MNILPAPSRRLSLSPLNVKDYDQRIVSACAAALANIEADPSGAEYVSALRAEYGPSLSPWTDGAWCSRWVAQINEPGMEPIAALAEPALRAARIVS